MSKPLSSGRIPEEIIAEFSVEYAVYHEIHGLELSLPTFPETAAGVRRKQLTTVRHRKRKRPMPTHEKF
jgi:hypothetical protein